MHAFCMFVFTCSAQVSMFHKEMCSRNTLIVIIIIIIIIIISGVCPAGVTGSWLAGYLAWQTLLRWTLHANFSTKF